jgi:hypothetical protein
MGIGEKKRYYCVNVDECQYARADHIYSAPYFRQHAGHCHGENNDGCGKELKADSINLWPRWLAAAFLIVCIAGGLIFAVQRVFFPSPVKGVSFAAQDVRATETGGDFPIIVNRAGTSAEPVVIEYQSVDGTARAGEQYQAIQGKLVFAAGEHSKTLHVVVLPASGALKPGLYFSIQLRNVEGAPQQMVYIDESKARQTESAQAEQTVRNVSVIAMDIADLMVRERVTDTMLEANRQNVDAFKRYEDRMHVLHGDLQRARERYEDSFRQMQSSSAQILQEAMDKVSADLARQGFAQQSKATDIMKRQFTEFLANKTFDMDRWANELSTVIPRPKDQTLSPST